MARGHAGRRQDPVLALQVLGLLALGDLIVVDGR